LAALGVYGDLFNVLPPLVQGITEYNSWARANQAGEWVKPVQICLNKSNHPHKGTGGYSHLVEYTFVWFFQKAPKIKELPYELNGNLLTVPRVQGNRRIPHWDDSTTPYNPTQKSHLWLKVFLNNHAVSSTMVVDLTAGSFSSFLACYLSPTPFHWMGSDIAPDSISQWEFVEKNLVANSPTKTWTSKFIQGTTRTPTFLTSYSC
jgi:hypothetical protein